eukprot:525793-Prymnesium_polylepis.1
MRASWLSGVAELIAICAPKELYEKAAEVAYRTLWSTADRIVEVQPGPPPDPSRLCPPRSGPEKLLEMGHAIHPWLLAWSAGRPFCLSPQDLPFLRAVGYVAGATCTSWRPYLQYDRLYRPVHRRVGRQKSAEY